MDFSLTSQSTELINLGSLSNAYPSLTDYLGNNRVVGPIDIGAFEAVFGGISEEEFSLEIVPNPVNDELVVVGATEGTYSIYSIEGQVMRRGALSAHPITVQGLPQGMYVIEINRNFNLETLTKKFIKL